VADGISLSRGVAQPGGVKDFASGLSGAVAMPALPAVDGQSRAQLLRAVSDIAAHFKRVEPHSPVSFLLDRAVMWADMPLDQWLAEVVGDDSVLGTIRDRIGVAR
jgi:type VI secretion system protein ImpA